VGGCVVLLAFIAATTPGRARAAGSTWTPSAAGQATSVRPCPSPAVAAYYETACWTVAPDPTNPFYSPDGPYPWAQCTYWVLEMRPDLWSNRSPSDPHADDWTAYTWPQHAALEGLAIDHAPSVGAIIVWPQAGGNETGHVAYVQSVSTDASTGDDRVTLQEMNDTTFDDPSQGQGDTMTMSMDAQDLAGVQIVHAPGNTTGIAPTTPPPPTPTATKASAPTRSTSARARRSRLSVRIVAHGVRVFTLSPAPLRATIVSLPSRTRERHFRLRPGAPLPSGRFELCVSQRATRAYRSARACAASGSGSGASRAALTFR
jgi:surface antigen